MVSVSTVCLRVEIRTVTLYMSTARRHILGMSEYEDCQLHEDFHLAYANNRMP